MPRLCWFLLFAVGCTPEKLLGFDDDDPEEEEEEAGPKEYGPDNGWYHAYEDEVPTTEECGYSQGDTICNFTLFDQYEDQVELYQFSGKVVVLDLFAEW